MSEEYKGKSIVEMAEEAEMPIRDFTEQLIKALVSITSITDKEKGISLLVSTKDIGNWSLEIAPVEEEEEADGRKEDEE